MSKRIHRRTYPLRTSNMALGGLVVAASLIHQPRDIALWAFVLVSALIWPHIAYCHSQQKQDHFRTEYVNGLMDAFIVGCWIPLMQFSILPSICMVAISVADRYYTGLRKRWLQSFGAILAGIACMSLWTQPSPHWGATFWVQLSLLPLILLHSVFASWSTKRMVKTLAKQNLQLQILGRIDPLTTVYSRDYWWQKARAALRSHRSSQQMTSLLIIDIDHFKRINDVYGHTVGDEVLQAIGLNIRHCLRLQDAAGRYGGDEFTVLCKNADVEVAYAVALRIRDQLANIRIREHPELRVSASIGVAAVDARFATVKEWIEAADSALYSAKAAGRDQIINAMDAVTDVPRRDSPATIPMPLDSTVMPASNRANPAEKTPSSPFTGPEIEKPERLTPLED